ncbi:MAG: preprotein translocase subunit SecG [Patescibacteria group bacterium]
MQVLKIVQIITALLLITVILLQNRGSGLSGIFGGDSNVYLAKRGMEKNLFIATIILAILFILVSLTSIIF